MKRFFCKPCGRIRRANSYPADVVMTTDLTGQPTPQQTMVLARQGTCWRHGRGRPMPRTVRRFTPPSRPATPMAVAFAGAKKGKR